MITREIVELECEECDKEFMIDTGYITDEEYVTCPYCQSDVSLTDDDEEYEEE